MKKYMLPLLLLPSLVVSQASVGYGKNKGWIIDETEYVNVPHSYEKIIRETYLKILSAKLGAKVQPLAHFVLPTLKHNIDKNLAALVFYKDKSKFDFLVETKMEVIKPFSGDSDVDKLYREMKLTVRIYDMETQKKVYEDHIDYNNAEYEKFVETEEEQDESPSDLELAIETIEEVTKSRQPDLKPFVKGSMENAVLRLADDPIWK